MSSQCCKHTDRVVRPSHIAPENHLVLSVDDIAMPMDGYTVPATSTWNG